MRAGSEGRALSEFATGVKLTPIWPSTAIPLGPHFAPNCSSCGFPLSKDGLPAAVEQHCCIEARCARLAFQAQILLHAACMSFCGRLVVGYDVEAFVERLVLFFGRMLPPKIGMFLPSFPVLPEIVGKSPTRSAKGVGKEVPTSGTLQLKSGTPLLAICSRFAGTPSARTVSSRQVGHMNFAPVPPPA